MKELYSIDYLKYNNSGRLNNDDPLDRIFVMRSSLIVNCARIQPPELNLKPDVHHKSCGVKMVVRKFAVI